MQKVANREAATGSVGAVRGTVALVNTPSTLRVSFIAYIRLYGVYIQ